MSVVGHSQAPVALARLDHRRRRFEHPLFDDAIFALALLVAGVAVQRIYHGAAIWTVPYSILLLLFRRLGISSRRGFRIDVHEALRDLAFASMLAAMIVLALGVLAGNASAATQTLTIWAVAGTTVVLSQIALSHAKLRARRHGLRTEPTLIVGAGRVGQLTAKRLLEMPEVGLRPIGFLDNEPLDIDDAVAAVPVVGANCDLESVIEHHGVRHVIFSFSTAPHNVLLQMVSRCELHGVPVSFVPRLFEKTTARMNVHHIGGLPLVSIHSSDLRGWQLRVKHASDRVAAAALLVLLSPILTICALAVWISMGRPILYRQTRLGRDGRRFQILKFRSMTNAPHAGDADPSRLPPDTAPGGVDTPERATRVGTILRNLSLDELPQLINVLRGEMSLVGPRPERPEFAEAFERTVYRYNDRLRMTPGITGWAQIHGLRGPTSLSDRVEWDNFYIENWSLQFDLKIVLRTIQILFRAAGG